METQENQSTHDTPAAEGSHVSHEGAPKKKFSVKMKKKPFLGLIIVILIAVAAVAVLNLRQPATPPGSNPTTQGPSVSVIMHVMSQCPYGVQAENGIIPVLRKFGNSINYTVYFIGGEQNGVFSSLHGEVEVAEDIRQACIIKQNPAKFIDYLECVNRDYQNVGTIWEQCARSASIDIAAVKTCWQGDEGKSLFRASIAASQAAGATGSPTIYVSGNSYSGKRDQLSFTREVCKGLQGHDLCTDMPACEADTDCSAAPVGKIGKCLNPGAANSECTYIEPVKVPIIVLNDATCTTCDTTALMLALQRLWPGLSARNVDVTSTEGKELVKTLNVEKVPAYLFDSTVSATDAWKADVRLQNAFEQAGDYYKILDQATGATHFVDEEKQKEFLAKAGVTLGDNKPQIDFFVMSYCPYGNEAEEAIAPVYTALKDTALFIPHYVIYSNYQGGGSKYCLDNESKYCSMHGIQEMNQGIRELCVNKLYGIGKYFDFVLAANSACTSQNVDLCWEATATALNISTARVKDCFKADAMKMAAEELALGEMLGVQGSPTVFVEGIEFQGQRTPEGFKQALCAGFETAPDACKAILQGASTASGTAAAGTGAQC